MFTVAESHMMVIHKYFKKQEKEQEKHLDQLDSSKETPIPLPFMVKTKSPIYITVVDQGMGQSGPGPPKSFVQ